jgi:hypothetical protein
MLAKDLPGNIRHLASLIARKPATFSPEWAATADEAFSLYTNTSTVNWVLALNDSLEELNWPFPAYLDLRKEIDRTSLDAFGSVPGLVRQLLRGGPTLMDSLLAVTFIPDAAKRDKTLCYLMRHFFARHSRRIFRFWTTSPQLAGKQPIVRAIRLTYQQKLWAACVPTTFALLDHIMRDYFETTNLFDSIQTLRKAFEKARILPKDLKPGSAIWDGRKDPSKGNVLARTMDEDLRLPGVLLSYFVAFADTYYGWFSAARARGAPVLNRHSVMHCGSDYWTPENGVRALTFCDLSLRLAPVLRILIHGPKAGPPPRKVIKGPAL